MDRALSPFRFASYGLCAEKGLALTLNAIGLGSDNPEFLRASPFGKMPGFTDGSFAISDSTAIITYLEAKFPQPFCCPAIRRCARGRSGMRNLPIRC